MDSTHTANDRVSRFVASQWLCCIAGLFLLALPVLAEELPEDSFLVKDTGEDFDWSRNFRVGAMAGLNIKANFKMGGNFGVSGFSSGKYEDGFAIPNPKNTDNKITRNWGYNSDSQYNAAANTLTLSRATSFTTLGNSATAENSSYVGFDMAYGGNLWKQDRVRIGWEFGFGLMPIDIKDNGSMKASVARTNSFFGTTGFVIMPPPGIAGGGDGRPAIDAFPTGGSSVTNISDITGSRSIEAILYTFRLGPTFYWEVSPKWAVSANIGAAMALVSGEYKYNEMVGGAGGTPNKGSIGMTDVVFGGTVGGMLMYHAEDNGDLYLGVQYMPMGNSTVSGNGRQATLDLSGQVYISAGINWPF